MAALHQWKRPRFLTLGVAMGPVPTREVVTTGTLQGWGAIHKDRIVKGVWGPHLRFIHINSLGLLAVYLGLRIW